MVLLVASIPVEDIESSIRTAKSALDSAADLVELRLDYLSSISVKDVESLLAQLPPEKCIFTVRAVNEGGAREHANWRKVLAHASSLCSTIDVEADRMEEGAFPRDANIVVSRHGSIDSLTKIQTDVSRHPNASMYKGAFAVSSLKEVSELVSLARQLLSKSIRFALSGMGPLGELSRYLLPLYGSRFAYVHAGAPTAVGQPSLQEFKRATRSLTMTEPEGIVCLLGKGIGQSVSPAMHNAAFRERGLRWAYLPLDVDEGMLSILKENSGLPIKGFNVTIPYKEEVIPYLDSLSPECERIKAANVILPKNGKLHGYNTDAEGFERALVQNLKRGGVSNLSGLRVMVIGAGGAARAAIYALAKGGAETYVFNRTKAKAESLAKEFGCALGGNISMIEVVAGKMDVIVNCTPITSSNESPVPQGALLPKHVVMDMVYHPLKTRLLKDAAIRGARTIEGIHMLAHQAALSFRIWTGKEIDADLMLRIGANALLNW